MRRFWWECSRYACTHAPAARSLVRLRRRDDCGVWFQGLRHFSSQSLLDDRCKNASQSLLRELKFPLKGTSTSLYSDRGRRSCEVVAKLAEWEVAVVPSESLQESRVVLRLEVEESHHHFVAAFTLLESQPDDSTELV